MGSTSSSRAPFVPHMLSAAVAALAGLAAVSGAEAKTPGHEYCFYGTCHRVQSIAETERQVGAEMVLKTSFYDDCKRDSYNPCGLTSSGEVFRADTPDNAASPVFPDGTTLLLFNPRTKGAAIVRVNNAGPYWGKRKLDVSRAAAEKLGFRKSGVADLKVRVIKAPTKAEATYRKNRSYARVPGYIGQYADASAAHQGFAMALAVEAMAGSLLAPAIAPALLNGRAGYLGTVVAPSDPIAQGPNAKPITATAAGAVPDASVLAKKKAAKATKAAAAKPAIAAKRKGQAAKSDEAQPKAKTAPAKLAAVATEPLMGERTRRLPADALQELTPLRGHPLSSVKLAGEPKATWY